MSHTPDPNLPDPTPAPVEPPLLYLARLEAESLLREPCESCGRVPKPIAVLDGIVRAVAPVHEEDCPLGPEDLQSHNTGPDSAG